MKHNVTLGETFCCLNHNRKWFLGVNYERMILLVFFTKRCFESTGRHITPVVTFAMHKLVHVVEIITKINTFRKHIPQSKYNRSITYIRKKEMPLRFGVDKMYLLHNLAFLLKISGILVCFSRFAILDKEFR